MFTQKDHTFAVCAYKESEYLEKCIESVLNQSVKTNVIIATSTDNEYIRGIANKYKLELFVNDKSLGIGPDWNFALSCAKTKLVTIAHQDDEYFEDYAKLCIERMNEEEHPIIFFSGYSEIRNGGYVSDSTVINVKKKLLSLIKGRHRRKSKFWRRRALSLGNAICCPAVTYIRDYTDKFPFSSNFKSNIDWEMWELLSREKGSFVYEPTVLMGHRIHEESTTSELIEDNTRTKEDYAMLCKFWPKWIAKIILKKYTKGQKSNTL